MRMKASLFQRWAERVSENAVRSFFEDPAFKVRMAKHVSWALRGFEPGYSMKDRERFTETVAARIHLKARRPIYWLGRRVWRGRMPIAECAQSAEDIVADFLHSENIKFGDPRYFWDDGSDLADADMEYWESCP